MGVRGIFTSASAMIAQQHRLDAISQNLANTTTTGYKREISVDKAFPELLIRRMDENVVKFPYRSIPSIGSIDKAPVVGTLGTGVEQNEIFTSFEQGPLKVTENPFDIALHGEGFFVVDTPHGERFTRNGNFIIGNGNILMTKEGMPILGEKGYIRVQRNNFRVDEQGRIFVNAELRNPSDAFVDNKENDWNGEVHLDSFRLVTFEFSRYLQKQGDSLLRDSEYTGGAQSIADDSALRPQFSQGALEASNVNPITEMVKMIEVHRSYEASQKAIRSQEASLERMLSLEI